MLIEKLIIVYILILNTKSKPILNQESECYKNESCGPLDNSYMSELTLRPSQKELCKFCDITLPIVRYLIKKNDTERFHEIATYICEELKIADNMVCDMAIKTYQVSN